MYRTDLPPPPPRVDVSRALASRELWREAGRAAASCATRDPELLRAMADAATQILEAAAGAGPGPGPGAPMSRWSLVTRDNHTEVVYHAHLDSTHVSRDKVLQLLSTFDVFTETLHARAQDIDPRLQVLRGAVDTHVRFLRRSSV
jgi:hypothetical protein